MSAQSFLRMVALVVPAAVSAAFGQVQTVNSYFAVVTADETMMRCGNEDNLYAIAKLMKAQLVRVDGEGGGWSRISYPGGTPALFPADSFQPDAGAKTGMVTKASKLKAFNLTTGVKGSWASVQDLPVAVGTKMTILEAEPASDGRGNSYYKVSPPESARGFVQSTTLRRATNEEIDAAAAKPAPATNSAPVNPPVAQPPKTHSPGATNPAASPQASPPQAPVNPPASAVEIKPPQPLPPSPYEKLEAAFEAVRKQPADSAEYSELMAEIQAAMNKLDDSEQSKTIRGRLQQRLNYLKLSSDLQAQKRKLADSQQTWSENDKIIKQRLDEVAKTRIYTLVGRLSASTIYDGKKLPLMYRVQTVGGPAPRTLAYLKPDTKLGIDSKLGQLVGVVGDSVIDPTLRITIITPLRVDSLSAADVPTSPATPATTESKPAADATDK